MEMACPPAHTPPSVEVTRDTLMSSSHLQSSEPDSSFDTWETEAHREAGLGRVQGQQTPEVRCVLTCQTKALSCPTGWALDIRNHNTWGSSCLFLPKWGPFLSEHPDCEPQKTHTQRHTDAHTLDVRTMGRIRRGGYIEGDEEENRSWRHNLPVTALLRSYRCNPHVPADSAG